MQEEIKKYVNVIINMTKRAKTKEDKKCFKYEAFGALEFACWYMKNNGQTELSIELSRWWEEEIRPFFNKEIYG